VGIGASAGGLEAFRRLLSALPSDTGMAYVLVQHLDPTQKGMMPELLQRATRMKVQQVKDRTRVRLDCVYVIPPNKDMSILHGVLHLSGHDHASDQGQMAALETKLRRKFQLPPSLIERAGIGRASRGRKIAESARKSQKSIK